MKRTEMVNRVGVEYLTSNVENEEYALCCILHLFHIVNLKRFWE